MIVKALMSTSEFPSPSRAIITSTAPSSGRATTRRRGADQSSTPKPKSTARRPRVASTKATKPPTSPPTPEHGVEEPDARLLQVEQVQGDGHAEHERGTGDHRLGAVQAHEQGEVAVAPDLPEAGTGAVEDAVRALVGVAAVVGGRRLSGRLLRSIARCRHRRHEEGGPQEREGVEAEHDGDVGQREEQRRPWRDRRRSPIDSMVLAATLAAVSSPGCVASDGSSAIWAGRNAVATTDGEQAEGVDRERRVRRRR